MSISRDVPPTLSTQRDGLRPKSPSEALEPSRAPQRPKGIKNPKPPNRKVSAVVRVLSGLLTVALVALGVSAAAGAFLSYEVEKEGPLDVTRAVAIPKGTSRNEMAERLAKEGVISSPWTFIIASHISERMGERKGQTLKYGDYEFKKGASIREVLDTIVDGKAILLKLTIPEGLTSFQIVERIKADPNLTGDVATVPPEGALFPDTYRYAKGATRQEILDQMMAKQKEVLAQAWEKRQDGLPVATPEQALVLASIVEKETGRADERERVAAVFVNRLKKNMRLESDPTVLYAKYGGAVQWGKPILQSELDAKSPHNTYENKGLPPTPICNPGRATIEATLNPDKTDEVYFVADGSGGHVFSTNLKDHNAAVAKWRKVEKDIRATEKTEKAKEESEAKPAEGEAVDTADPAAPAKPADKAAAAEKAPAKAEGQPAPGQRAVIRTVPPAATNSVPNPPAEQPAKAAKEAAPAAPASPVKTVTPAAAPTGSTAAPAVKVVTPAPAGTSSPVKTVPAPGTAPASASTLPLPVRKPKAE
jgi:UPF0755 protein